MRHRFFMVMISINPGLTVQDVQNALTNQIQWYRVANNVWVVHTVQPSHWLFNVLTPLCQPSGTLLITQLEPSDKNGWMPPEFWKWLTSRQAIP